MRRDVLELRDFYASPLGAAVRRVLSAKLYEAWGDAAGLDVLGLGYATPWLEDVRATARRAVAAMPASQGVEVWPGEGRPLSALAEETALPFMNAIFDRVLIVHGLEEAEDPTRLLAEAWRVLAPNGRVIVAAANRRGMWSRAEHTPFGQGRPYTRRQLERLLREAELEPFAWSRALYVPPWDAFARWGDAFEQAGPKLWPPFSGLILLEAVKRTFAVKPQRVRERVRVLAPAGAIQPATRAPED